MKIVHKAGYIPPACLGENCTLCNKQALHKVGEEDVEEVSSVIISHNYTAYVCCECFCKIMKLSLCIGV